MPTVPIPQQVPIERASWGQPIENGMGQAAAAIGQIPSAVTQANNIQQQLAQSNAMTGQAANAVMDLKQKQRAFQTSMLNGVMALPEEQQADALAKVVPMMNRMGPTQYDTGMTPAQARMIMMSNVPVEQLPMYQMNAAKAAWYNRMANPGGQQPMGNPQPNPSQSPEGTPMPPNGVIGGAQPVPQGGGSPISPTDSLLNDPFAAVIEPQAVTATATAKKTQFETNPQAQAQLEGAKEQAKNTVEAQKNALESNEDYQQVAKTIDSLKSMIGTVNDKGNVIPNPDLPQSHFGVPAKGQAWVSQNFPGDNQAASNAYNTFQTLNESQTINAIRDLANTGQIKMTRTLENIINRGYLIDPDVSPKAKMQQADAIKTELANSAAAAQNVASKMGGVQVNAPYQAPYTAPQQPQASKPNLVAGQTVYKGHLYLGGDPGKPESWQKQGGK
jgi:hypothetical protein